MSSNNRTSTPKRLRSSDDGISEDQQGKKQRLESILGSMTRSVNVTWSGSTTTKRARSKSSEPAERNVRSRMTAEVTSTNPEPTSFLMAGLARELDIIDQGLSSGATCSTVGSNHSPSSSHTHSPSTTPPAASDDSSDFYDTIWESITKKGQEMQEHMRIDPFYSKFYDDVF